MKIVVDLSTEELGAFRETTGIENAGDAVRELAREAIMFRKRAAIAQKFLTGEWSTELEGFEESRRRDREKSAVANRRWRD